MKDVIYKELIKIANFTYMNAADMEVFTETFYKAIKRQLAKNFLRAISDGRGVIELWSDIFKDDGEFLATIDYEDRLKAYETGKDIEWPQEDDQLEFDFMKEEKPRE